MPTKNLECDPDAISKTLLRHNSTAAAAAACQNSRMSIYIEIAASISIALALLALCGCSGTATYDHGAQHLAVTWKSPTTQTPATANLPQQP